MMDNTFENISILCQHHLQPSPLLTLLTVTLNKQGSICPMSDPTSYDPVKLTNKSHDRDLFMAAEEQEMMV